MGASAENFCLRWNDFESNVSSSFRDLRNEADFFDVTLATSDSGSRTLQAHKVILSACSNFFKQILRQQTKIHSHPNPLIYLRGVTHDDLMSVLDFMYHGEVNVAQDDLNSFLAVAEELQIKGLTNKDQPEPPSSGSSKISRPLPGRVKDPGPPPKRIRKSSPGLPVHSQITNAIASTSVAIDDDDEDIKEVVNVKIDPETPITIDAGEAVNPDEEGYDDSYGEYYDEGSGGMEGDGTEEDSVAGGTSEGAKAPAFGVEKLENNDGKCLICGRYFSLFTNARRHFLAVHMPDANDVSQCPICKKVYKSQMVLNQHKRQMHGIYSTTPKDQLNSNH